MERVRWETYKGKKILVIDYTGLKAAKPDEKKTINATAPVARYRAIIAPPLCFLL